MKTGKIQTMVLTLIVAIFMMIGILSIIFHFNPYRRLGGGVDYKPSTSPAIYDVIYRLSAQK